MTNSSEKLNKFKSKLKEIYLSRCDYSSDLMPEIQDIFIFFNRSREHEEYKAQVDLIKILSFVKRNLI